MQTLLSAFVVIVLWLGPVFALTWVALLARSHFHGGSKRNPLTTDLLRGPGHTLREGLDDTRMDMLAILAVISSTPLAMTALYYANRDLGGTPTPSPWFYALVAVGGFAFGAYKIVRLVEHARNLRLGFEAECAVGEELNQLMKDGFSVFHDIPGDADFNVDHVVVGPTGVFAVETKGRAKRTGAKVEAGHRVELQEDGLAFPGWTTQQPLEQARRNATWLAKWLSSAVGEPIKVKPAVVLPGWYVELKSKCDVAVLSGKQCRGYFPKAKADPLSEKQILQISHQLDARCRDVERVTYVKPKA